MKMLSTASGLRLNWVQPTMLMRHFELYSENDLVGELRFEKASRAHGTWTVAGSKTAGWTIKGAGFFKRRVIVQKSEAKDDLAIFRSNLRGEGWVEFFKGSKFHWKSTNSWRTEWGFSSVGEGLLLVFESQSWFRLKMQSSVEITGQWRDLDELPVLVMLGWYLRVQNFYAGW